MSNSALNHPPYPSPSGLIDESILAESDSHYRLLVANLPDGVILHDAEGKVVMCNASAERILGLSTEQLLGFAAFDPTWHTIHEDYSLFPRETHPDMIALQTGLPVTHVVMGIYKPDDSLTWILANAQPLFTADSQRPSSVAVSFTDITEVKRATEQGIELRVQRERTELLADFITNTSHELRTPLSIINSSAYLLNKLQDPVKRQQKTDQIIEQVRYLDRTISQLQDMSKLNQIWELRLSLISPYSLLERFTLHYSIKRQSVGVKVLPCVDVPNIAGNMEYLMLALGYLVDNAVRYSPNGDAVLLYAEHHPTETLICVEDHGIGIPDQYLDPIFDQFYKIDSSRTQNDTAVGMGLTMVRRIMELHGGRVDVSSDPGHKTVFTLYFPRKMV